MRAGSVCRIDMQAVRLHEHGGPDVLTVEEVDRPDPTTNELLVEVAAAGVNPVDTYFRDGSYTPVSLPFTPGVDVAGVVESVGADVTDFAPGDRVLGTGIGNTSAQGAYAEYATLPVENAVSLPEGASLAEAGAAGVAACTAWRALVDIADLDPAETCLVHGGSGGVGHAAVQIAAAVEARTVTTTAPEYHDAVADLGADVVLDYERTDLAKAVQAAAEGGVDVTLDHRLDDYLQFDGDVAAADGRVVGIGENDQHPAFTQINAVRGKDVSYHFMSLFNTPDIRDPLGGVAHLMETGSLRIALARRYDLEEAAEAQRAVIEDSFLGKLVVEP